MDDNMGKLLIPNVVGRYRKNLLLRSQILFGYIICSIIICIALIINTFHPISIMLTYFLAAILMVLLIYFIMAYSSILFIKVGWALYENGIVFNELPKPFFEIEKQYVPFQEVVQILHDLNSAEINHLVKQYYSNSIKQLRTIIKEMNQSIIIITKSDEVIYLDIDNIKEIDAIKNILTQTWKQTIKKTLTDKPPNLL